MWRPWCDSVSSEVPDRDDCGGHGVEVRPQQQPRLAGSGNHLTKGQQAAVISMMGYAKENGSANPVSDVTTVLGVGQNTVYRILRKALSSPKKRGPTPGKYKFQRLDDFQKKMIQRTIYNRYANNEVPTVPSLRRELMQKDEGFNYSERHLRRVLNDLGFKFRKLDRRGRIMLSNRIVKLRDQYLFRMQQLRASRQTLIFLDETWYDSHDVVNRGWRDESVSSSLDTPPSRGKRIIILHAGCEAGWIPGALLIAAKNIKNASADYHQDMNADLFESWFENQLLPGLKTLFPEKTCTIVMDNAPYHGRLVHKTPTIKMKKSDIVETLRSLGINIPTTIADPNKKPRKPTKDDLLKLYKDAGIEKQYRVDQLAYQQGHQVVRLPPYYCIFNPIELIWAALKSDLRRKNTSPSLSAGVLELVRNSIKHIGEDLWRKCIQHAEREERKYSLAPTLEPFIISVESDADEDSSDEDEDLDLGCTTLDLV